MTNLDNLRRTNKLPFEIIGWLEVLTPVVEHDQLGMMYKGHVLAEDSHGRYQAIIGTTDYLLGKSRSEEETGTPFRILRVLKSGMI